MAKWLGKRRFNYPDVIGLGCALGLIKDGYYAAAAVVFIASVIVSVTVEAMSKRNSE